MSRTPKRICQVRTATLIMDIDDNKLPAYVYLDKLLMAGWNIEVVDQRRGYCAIRERLITIPVWAFDKSKAMREYYLAHELAHVLHYETSASYTKDAVHGQEFMKCFKKLCSPQHWHLELHYKPQNAAKAGIMVIPEDF